jgi:hypothetical protein
MSYVGNTNTTQGFTPAVDYFSGNGSTVAFTLSRPVASVAQVQVVVNNVAQNPTDAYTVLNNTITFTGAPSSGTNNIYVYYTSPITQVIQPGQGTVGTAQIQNGAVIPADLSTGAPSWDTSGNLSGIANLTTTGNTVLGDASTDTLNVGNGDLVKNASGSVGIGISSPAAKLHVYASAGDISGQIQTAGAGQAALNLYNSTRQFRLIADASESAFVIYDQTASAERARINSSGIVTMPYQPAYRCVGVGGGFALPAGKITSIPTAYFNRGGHYSAATQRFTAPVAGVYYFYINLFGVGSNDRIGILVNGIGDTTPYMMQVLDNAQSGSITVQINAGDYVEFFAQYGTSTIYLGHCGLGGYLVS